MQPKTSQFKGYSKVSDTEGYPQELQVEAAEDKFIRYEGGGADSRVHKRYGDDINKFNVKDATEGLGDGMKTERKCTNIFFLLLWFAFLGSMVGLTVYSKNTGDLGRLIASVDGDDKLCGQKGAGREEFKYLYITDFRFKKVFQIFEEGVCVKKCPEADDAPIDYHPTAQVPKGKPNMPNVYQTHTVLTYCIPDLSDGFPADQQEGWKLAWKSFISSEAGSYFNDLYMASKAIYISIGMGLVYCFLFILVMRFFAEPLAWFLIVVVQIGLCIPPVACLYYRWLSAKSYDSNKALVLEEPVAKREKALIEFQENFDFKQYWLLVGAIASGVVCLLMLCCICCGFKSLKLAIDVIDEASAFLAKTQRLLVVQLFFYILAIGAIILWLPAIFCVISLNEVEPSNWIPQVKHITWESKLTFALFLFMVFAIIWITAFLDYTNKFIVQVSAASYYFSSTQEEDGSAQVCLGFKFAIQHMGSIALGSLIIGIVRFIKLVFITVAQAAAKTSGDNAARRAVIKCGVCYLQCLEKITDYVSESAFSYMAVTGDDFCASAWNGFLLQVKHIQAFAFANSLATAFIFVGKVGITVANCFTCEALIQMTAKTPEEVPNWIAPVAVVGLCTYLTAVVFLSIFDTGVLGLMTAMAFDLDLNGSLKSGPKSFHETLDKIKERKGEVDEADAEWQKNAAKYR